MERVFFKGVNRVVLTLGSVITIALFSCSKKPAVAISTPVYTVGKTVQPGNIGGTIKGTLVQDSVYYVTSDVVINAGDTLYIQPGVKVYFTGNYNFWIHGNLVSVGTKADPIYFTVKGQQKNDVVGQDPTTDPAYKGLWGGLQGDTSTQFMIIKYTHVEFAGGLYATAQTFGTKNNALASPVRFVNTKASGLFVVEDSWFYGEVDGGATISIAGGEYHIMRNIFEKSGFSGGECVEARNGSQGNIAYNLMVGPCTNGIKVDNGGTLSQANATSYNNTIINGGYRRFVYGGAGNSLGRGGSIDYEQGARGQVYNNLLVDSKYGLRIVGTGNYSGNALVVADTANMFYGNNYNYGDSLVITNQFYPLTLLTKPQPTDIPTPSTYLPVGYTLGANYDGSSLVGKNNPLFVSYSLPINYGTSTVNFVLGTTSFVGSSNFHLQSSSPAIGKGTTNFSISAAVTKIDPIYGATEITPPGVDEGCYQSNGSGLKN